jgi:tetratricopeptide (TPR) repeat protein
MQYTYRRIARALAVTVLMSSATGCLSWEPGWKDIPAASGKGDVKVLMEKAQKLEGKADTREKLEALIAAYEEVLKVDPQNFEVLTLLGSNYFLLAYGYCTDVKEKAGVHMKGISVSERAMYTNPEFKKLADGGKNVWEACGALTAREMYPLYSYYINAGQFWNVSLGALGKLFNLSWVGRSRTIIERMTELDPAWRSGSVYTAWGTLYAVPPRIAGGDMKKAEEYLNKAITAGPRMTNFYVNRALYLHVKTRNREAFVDDLNRAIAIDPRNAGELRYPLAVYYRNYAMQLLRDVDKYFK